MTTSNSSTSVNSSIAMAGARLVHTMLRVASLECSLAFYTGPREDYPEGRFTLAFVGYGSEATGAVIELTWNWDKAAYDRGTGYGHIALVVSDAA